MAAGDTKRLVVQMREFGEPIQFSHFFRARTVNATPDTLVGAYVANIQPLLLACLSQDVAIESYAVQDFIPGTGLTYQSPIVPNPIGAVAVDGDAPQLAGVISWFTSKRGPGNRGRTFMPGLPHTFTNDGRMSAAGLAAYNDYAITLIDRFDATGVAPDPNWVLVLWRQHLTGAGAVEPNPPFGQPGHVAPVSKPPYNPLAAAEQITSHLTRTILRTQRRRAIQTRI